MLTNLFHSNQDAITGCTQDAARVAFRHARVGLSCSSPVHAPEGVTAAGFDHSMAIASSLKPRTEPDMKCRFNGKRSRSLFCQPTIDDDKKLKGQKDVCIRINQDGNFICFQRSPKLILFNETGSHAFNGVVSLVNC